MALIDGRIGTQEIVIFPIVDVVKVYASAPMQDDGEGMVVVRTVFSFEEDGVEGLGG